MSNLPHPWALERLRVERFRCFSELDIEFDPQLTVIVGTNGAGKTALLDATAVMLSTITSEMRGDRIGFGEFDARATPIDLQSVSTAAHMQYEYPIVGCATALVDGMSCTWKRARDSSGVDGKSSRTTWAANDASRRAKKIRIDAERAGTSPLPVLPVIAYYGVERMQHERRNRGSIAATRFGAYDACLDPRSDLRRLNGFLDDLTRQITQASLFGDEPPLAARAQLEALDLACGQVLASTGWAKPRWSGSEYGGVSLSHPERGRLPLSVLASGIRITALLAIDIASRAARANPAIGAEQLLTEVPGIVLVDEIDLHLHPDWQQRIVNDLRMTFPSIQFVMTTHSPQVISTVPPEQIRNLANVVDGLVQAPRHARGLGPEAVLREIMEVDPIPRTAESDDMVRYLEMVYAGSGRTPPAQELRASLDRRLGGPGNRPELADADAHMSLEEIVDS